MHCKGLQQCPGSQWAVGARRGGGLGGGGRGGGGGWGGGGGGGVNGLERIRSCARRLSVPHQGLGREGREPKARGLALKGGKSPAKSPGFRAIPAWYREMQIGS
jgi:hypothetical protein